MSLSAELHGQKDTSRIKQEPDLSSVLCFKRKRLVLSELLWYFYFLPIIEKSFFNEFNELQWQTLLAQKPSDRRPICGVGDLLAPLLTWSRDLVRSRTLTSTGTSSECPELSAQAQSTSSCCGCPQGPVVATMGSSLQGSCYAEVPLQICAQILSFSLCCYHLIAVTRQTME